MNIQPIWQADVFFGSKSKGNQATVFLLDNEIESVVMKTLASEQSKPASVFIWPLSSKLYAIRWFSPSRAISLCGHATLAAAKAINEIKNTELIDFVSEDNILISCRLNDEQASIILPLISVEPVEIGIDFINTLNANIQKQYQTQDEQGYVVLELNSAETVREVKPNFDRLTLTTQRAIIVTALNKQTKQIAFRYFAPQYGNNEDQATGSALCVLADFYSKEYAMQSLNAIQLSEHGGEMQSELIGDSVEVYGKVRLK